MRVSVGVRLFWHPKFEFGLECRRGSVLKGEERLCVRVHLDGGRCYSVSWCRKGEGGMTSCMSVRVFMLVSNVLGEYLHWRASKDPRKVNW